MSEQSGHIAFTGAVKAVQGRRGSRAIYAKVEAGRASETIVTPELAAFVAQVNTAYIATASADGRPYVQHRGGPKGFIRVLGNDTLAFADLAGNRQYITLGNLAENDRALLFLVDYANPRRVKVWGRARVVEDDVELITKLMVPDYKARPEHAILLTVEAWDLNCSRHIPQKLNARDVLKWLKRSGVASRPSSLKTLD